MCLVPYKACVCAAAFSIFQSILHMGWCIWGISLYNCEGTLHNQTFTYFWYLTYFYRNQCTNVTFDFTVLPVRSLNDTQTPLLEPVGGNIVWHNSTDIDFAFSPHYEYKQNIKFPAESAAANRTNTILTVFCAFDSLWIITAVILLCGTGLRITDCGAIVFYFPWVLVLFFILFLDMIAGCWYLCDAPQTNGLTKWFLFIGAENQSIFVELEKKNPRESSMMPSILMFLLFSRFLFIWLINLFLFFRIFRIGMDMVKGRAYVDDESKTSNQGHLDRENVVNTHRPRDFQVSAASTNSTSVRIRRWEMYYGTDDEEEEPVERKHRRRRSRQKSVTVNEGWHISNAFQYDQAAATGKKLAVIGGYEGDRSNSPSPLPRSSQKVYSSGSEATDYHAPVSEQSVQSSTRDYVEICQVHQKQTTSCVSELRSQLPWSYFQDRNELVLPKSFKREDVMPPIPIPDYTLKFNDKTKSKAGAV